MEKLTRPTVFSVREKLLLGLLSSTLLFSFSFSYGAVNQNKVDAIMKMITDGGARFSDVAVSGQTKSERTQYYEKVDAGLGDAVEMLAVVRNNIRSLLGLSPAYTADDIVGGILGGVIGGVGTSNPSTGLSQAMASCPVGTQFIKEVIKDAKPVVDLFEPGIQYKSLSPTTYAVFTATIPDVTSTSDYPKAFVIHGAAGANAQWILNNPRFKDTKNEYAYDEFEYSFSTSTACVFDGPSVMRTYSMNAAGTLSIPIYPSDSFQTLNKSAYYLKAGTKYYITVRGKADESGKYKVRHRYNPVTKTDLTYSDKGGTYGIPFTEDALYLMGQGGTFNGNTPPTSASFIPFRNSCPAGLQPSGGWDIRTPVMGYASSVGNLLIAPLGKPIVVAINVPVGYTTTTATSKVPSALIGQAQAGLSEGAVSVSSSTASCSDTPDSSRASALNGSPYKFYTADDSRYRASDFLSLLLVPGQVNYVTIWDLGASFGSLKDQGKYGVNIQFKNWSKSAGGNSETSAPTQNTTSPSNFSYFTPTVIQTFPTGSTPHLVGNSGSTPPTPPAPVTNPIANYPIPAPCMAGTVINKELMGVNNGAWIRREFSRATDIVPGHVYKLRIDEEDGQGNGGVAWADAPPERINQAVKISPYPCDFVTLAEEKKYFGDRISVAPSLTTWWNSVTVPATTQVSTCMSVANSNNLQYKIGAAFLSPSIASVGTCTLLKGVTYYVNVRPSFTQMHGNGCNGTYACNYVFQDYGNQKITPSRPQLWSIYNTYEEFLVYKLKANISSENAESLRQKVVSDYATRGVNTDGLTNTALGGTAVTPPPVGIGGGPVVVREGPWERTDDIFCPDTLDGPSGLRTLYPNGYNYYNQGNTYWNVKNYLTPTDNTLPTSCTTGKKFIKHGLTATCYEYTCVN